MAAESSNASSGASSGDRPFREAPASSLSDSAVDPALLARVMQQTLAAADAQDSTLSADLQKLRAVAHRRKGQGLVLEPVVIEMVRAMLGAQFAGLDADPQRFNEVTMKVARTLLDDPVSSKRLENLWARLADG